MNKENILKRATDALLENTGMETRWNTIRHHNIEGTFHFPDGLLEIEIDKAKKILFNTSIQKELRLYQLAQIIELSNPSSYFMYIVDRISPNLKEILRERKIGYLDTAGNMFINTKEAFIWIDGQKNAKIKSFTYNRAFTKTGLRVIFYLLLENNAINMPYRILSEITGVSTGNISNVINGLDAAGFVLKVDRKKMVLRKKKMLLTRWIAGYDETLKPSLLLGKYRIRLNNWKDLPTQKGNDFWSGESAVELMIGNLQPSELILYSDQSKNYEQLKLILLPAALEGNIEIYEKFWNHETFDKQWYAPPLLVYADLVLTNDPRCIDAANIIYTEFLKDEFDEPERRRTEASN